MLQPVPGTDEVDPHDGHQGFRRCLFDRAQAGDSRIVDQEIEPSEAFHRLVRHALPVRFRGNVLGQVHHAHAKGPEVRLGPPAIGLGPRRDDDMHARIPERLRASMADARAADGALRDGRDSDQIPQAISRHRGEHRISTRRVSRTLWPVMPRRRSGRLSGTVLSGPSQSTRMAARSVMRRATLTEKFVADCPGGLSRRAHAGSTASSRRDAGAAGRAPREERFETADCAPSGSVPGRDRLPFLRIPRRNRNPRLLSPSPGLSFRAREAYAWLHWTDCGYWT